MLWGIYPWRNTIDIWMRMRNRIPTKHEYKPKSFVCVNPVCEWINEVFTFSVLCFSLHLQNGFMNALSSWLQCCGRFTVTRFKPTQQTPWSASCAHCRRIGRSKRDTRERQLLLNFWVDKTLYWTHNWNTNYISTAIETNKQIILPNKREPGGQSYLADTLQRFNYASGKHCSECKCSVIIICDHCELVFSHWYNIAQRATKKTQHKIYVFNEHESTVPRERV